VTRQSHRSRGDGVPPAWRDLAIIVVVLLAIESAAAWFLVRVYLPQRRDEAFAAARAQLAMLARDRQIALNGWVRERLSDAELTASLLDAGRESMLPAALLDHFATTYGYESAVIVTGDHVSAKSGRPSDDAMLIDFAKRLPSNRRSWIDFRRAHDRTPKVITACRIASTQQPGQESTVLFVSDPYQYVYPLFSTVTIAMKSGETNLIGLYDGWGVALNPYPGGSPPPLTVRMPIPKSFAAWALDRGEATIRITDRDGMNVIGIVKAIAGTPWIVFAKIDEDEVLSGAMAETIRIGQLFTLAALLLGAMAFAFVRSRRVHKMRAAEDQLARLYANTTTAIVMLRVVFDHSRHPVDHEMIGMNPAAEALFDVVAAEEIGNRSGDAAYLQWPPAIRGRNYEVAITGSALEYEQYDATTDRWLDTRCFSPRYGEVAQLLTDVTARRKSEDAVHLLSARLLRIQDETRRRIARELHETIAQSLAGLRMNLGMLKADAGVERERRAVAESITIVDQTLREVRTMSYLLHPPMIDQAGLPTALRWYIEGFQDRSGIVTALDVPDDLGRLSRDLETSAFRIIQECLTNVQRHSGSTTARVSLQRSRGSLSIEVADDGRGIAADLREDHAALLASGVGIAGINERAHELGGSMTVTSTEDGTRIVVKLPVPDLVNEERMPVTGATTR
jgi:signal transduction histidine kinase